LLKRLRFRGIRVPEDIAVIGYLNHYLCDYVDPPLTSLDLRHHLSAKSMVGAVQEMINGGGDGSSPKAISIAPMVVVRESA
jgi:DNA-binding LacI/PurR family transcriptional regulator